MKKVFSIVLLVLFVYVSIRASRLYVQIRTGDDCKQYDCGVIVNITYLRPVILTRISEEGEVLNMSAFEGRVVGYFTDDYSSVIEVRVSGGSFLILDSESLLLLVMILWGIVIRVLRITDWKSFKKKKVTI